MNYHIKEISDISGVSIRMLRYYESRGLLDPERSVENDYRVYSDNDLDRLLRIMFLRELGFTVKETKELVEATEDDVLTALLEQEKLFAQKIERLMEIRKTISLEVKRRIEMGESKGKNRFGAFDMKEFENHRKKYAAETKEKYGNTKAYSQSAERTSRYTSEDWKRIKGEADVIYRRLNALSSKNPNDPDVQEAVDAWRNHLDKYYYDCTDEIFEGLAQTYANDPRFMKNIDKYGEGLALFMSKAMQASLPKK